MQRAAFKTPVGEVWMWGEHATLPPDKPVILVIPGVFCRPDAFWFRMQPHFPEATVLTTQLPGYCCPPMKDLTVERMASAFGDVLQNQLGGRPVLVCGESIGGTVTLALPNPGIGRLALDPPLRTGGLWSLREFFTLAYANSPWTREMLENVFGFDGRSFRDIDYRALVTHPARVLVGTLPLQPERPTETMPSVLDEPERQFLQDKAFIEFTDFEGVGHVMIWYEHTLIGVIREELVKVVQDSRLRAPTWIEADPVE